MSTEVNRISLDMQITIEDNSEEILAALENAIERGLEAIGMTAEGYAKETLTNTVYTRTTDPDGYKLTGRLRNSITFALAGKKADAATYADDEGNTYQNEGTAPNDGDGVYIGTNVVYAAGIETGTRRNAGGVHFLQKAVSEHGEEYKQIMKDSLENA